MSNDETWFGDTGAARPLCCRRRCSDRAVILTMRNARPDGRIHPFCAEHDPDLSVRGNKTTWSDKLVVREYSAPARPATIYGRPGDGVMHVENSAGTGTLCPHDISPRLRYNLTVAARRLRRLWPLYRKLRLGRRLRRPRGGLVRAGPSASPQTRGAALRLGRGPAVVSESRPAGDSLRGRGGPALMEV